MKNKTKWGIGIFIIVAVLVVAFSATPGLFKGRFGNFDKFGAIDIKTLRPVLSDTGSVLYTNLNVKDDDLDGVPNNQDKCPNTPLMVVYLGVKDRVTYQNRTVELSDVYAEDNSLNLKITDAQGAVNQVRAQIGRPLSTSSTGGLTITPKVSLAAPGNSFMDEHTIIILQVLRANILEGQAGC